MSAKSNLTDFVALILTHGRPDKVKTIKTLRKSGYTGRIVLVIDNEDKTAHIYKSLYGEEDVVMFDKLAISKTFDQIIPGNRKTIVYARNASFEIAKQLGYRIYLYFVSTKDVEINIKRVQQRVKSGGHNVPEEKIRKRYDKALENLFETLRLCDRAYLFDNSDEEWVWLAELDGDKLELKQDVIPDWLHTYVLSKIIAE